MNPQETQQVIARDEKWVPSIERVKISSTNVRLETTVHQKEETFQVVIDVIKNSTCFKAFTISTDVPEIFMQQFWYTIKKIMDTYPRVEGEEFTEVQDNDATLAFLIDLGYKGLIHKFTNISSQHVHRSVQQLLCVHLEEHVKILEHLRLKFIRIGEDYQEYGLAIPDMMLNDTIKQSESYQMFLKYSTGQIPPKKIRCKAKKRSASRRVVKKKGTISAADNIIPDPDVTLELGKSISLTETARKVYATHARIVSNKVSPSPSLKLKGVQSLTPEEQEVADTMKALEESKKISKRQPGTRGSSEGTGKIPGVPDESTIVSATSSEGTGTKPGVLDEDKFVIRTQVVSKSPTHYLCDLARTFRVILFSFIVTNGNPSSVNIKKHRVKDYQGRLLVGFQDGIKYEHVGPKTQDRKMEKMMQDLRTQEVQDEVIKAQDHSLSSMKEQDQV
ncbi:hypothetical protein Tco_0355785 [Tanacetum coccineum]